MRIRRAMIVATAIAIALGAVGAASAGQPVESRADLPDAADVRVRDLVIDQRGLGYLRSANGGLTPYGHSVPASRPVTPRAPGGVPGPPGGGGAGGDTVTFGQWDFGGQVLRSAGRILFELADGWYVCSGTVVDDATTGRSIVLTAAHCVYDDVEKEFARSAIFVPNQDDGGNDGTDFDCSNDPDGCWVLDHGVVDVNWTTRTFPDNIPWDYGYYVVSDSGSHSTSDTATLGDLALDGAVGAMAISFSTPAVGDVAHALGYSYDVDPEFMYCKEALDTNGSANYWLGRCDMAGGSSGGPWVQPMNETTGDGPVFSVNSWGYTFQSGMAGPKLHGTSASEIFAAAKSSTLGGGGVVVTPGGSTTTTTTTTTVPSTGLDATSVNNGSTWTAVVTGPDGLGGTFDTSGTATCAGTECRLTGIPKRVASVTFTASVPEVVAGESIVVSKP